MAVVKKIFKKICIAVRDSADRIVRSIEKAEIERLIEIFAAELTAAFPGIVFKVDPDYDQEDYIIWHNYKDHNNPDFVDKVGEMVHRIFWENDVYNVCFSHSYKEEIFHELKTTIPDKKQLLQNQ